MRYPDKVIYLVRKNKMQRYHVWIGDSPFNGLSEIDITTEISILSVFDRRNTFGLYRNQEELDLELNDTSIKSYYDLITENEQEAYSFLSLN